MAKTIDYAKVTRMTVAQKKRYATTIGMTYTGLNKLLNDPSREGRNLVYDAVNGTVIPVNLFKDDVSGIIRSQFNIGRVVKKKITDVKNVRLVNNKKEIYMMGKIRPDEDVKMLINVEYYVTSPSIEYVFMEDILQMIKEIVEEEREYDHDDFKEYLEEEYRDIKDRMIKPTGLFKRNLVLNFNGTGRELLDRYFTNLNIEKVNEQINVGLNNPDIVIQDEFIERAKNGIYGEALRTIFDRSRWGGDGKPLYVKIDILSTYEDRKLNIARDGTISELNIYQLEEWANIQYDNEGDEDDSCAVKYINDRFPDLYYKFKKHELVGKNKQKYMETKKFLNLCKKYDIDYEVYNVSGELEEINQSEESIGKIVCIIYQNHIYPIKGGKLRKKRNTDYKVVHVQDNSMFIKHINDRKIPSRIIVSPIYVDEHKQIASKISNLNIISFTSQKKRYINNPDYDICSNFLNKVDLGDMIKDDIKITMLIDILEKSQKVPDVKSFIPDNCNFTKTSLLWKTDKKIDYDRVVVKDKNKAYPCALYNLPYLIKFDFRKNKVRKFTDKTKINDEYLYFVRVNEWTNAIPEDNLYAGYHLKECMKYGVDFEIVEELETEIVANYYRQIIDLTRKYLDEDTFKTIWVRYIGCMESGLSSSIEYNYKAIYTNDQKEFYSGFHSNFGKKHGIVFDVKESYKNVRNKFPIATQIKDMSRMTVIREIINLGLKQDDIVQLKTDAIAYYGKKSKDLDPRNFFGWKDEKFVEMDYRRPDNKILYGLLSEEDINNNLKNLGVLDLKINDSDKRIRKLHMQYAGAGKTTYILKQLIPKLLKEGYKKDEIIVLTPTHCTLAEYKREGINCEIIQKYTFDNTIAKEKYIIIDEIGCIETSCHDMLYKLVVMGKNIECFGDFNQLQPVGEDKRLNQEHYLKYIFKEINTKYTNYRNNFSKKYYDSIINTKVNKSLKNDTNKSKLSGEIKKWESKQWKDAEYILCYRHKTKEKYNNLMLKSLGKKSWKSVGVRVICDNNKLRDLGIWNKKEFIIKKIKGDDKDRNIVLRDKYKIDDDITITEKQLEKNFSMAYACNVHQIQGATLKSYYWASEDDMFLDGHVAYTIISRLRQEKNK